MDRISLHWGTDSRCCNWVPTCSPGKLKWINGSWCKKPVRLGNWIGSEKRGKVVWSVCIPIAHVGPPYPGSHLQLSGPTLTSHKGSWEKKKRKLSRRQRCIRRRECNFTRFRADTVGRKWGRSYCCPPSERNRNSNLPILSSSLPTIFWIGKKEEENCIISSA